MAMGAPRLRHGCSWIWLLLCVWLLGCGARKPAAEVPQPPQPPREPWAWVPPDAMLMGHVVLAPFRSTPIWPQALSLLSRLPEGSAWFDPALTRRVAFGGTQEPGQPPSFVAALEGPFGEGYLARRASAEARPGEIRGPFTLYRVGELVWAQIYPELLLSCTEDRIDDLLRRVSRQPDASAKQTPLYTAFAPRLALKAADLVLLAQDPSGAQQDQLSQLAGGFGLNLGDVTLVRAGFAASLDESTLLAGSIETADAAQARRLADATAATIDSFSGGLLMRMLGVRPLLQAIQVTAPDQHVALQARLPRAELLAVLAKLKSLLEMGNQLRGSAAGSATSAAP